MDYGNHKSQFSIQVERRSETFFRSVRRPSIPGAGWEVVREEKGENMEGRREGWLFRKLSLRQKDQRFPF